MSASGLILIKIKPFKRLELTIAIGIKLKT
jgi:hypothetical protein